MVDFFYRIQFRIGCSKICTAWNKLVTLILSLIYPIYCRLFPLKESGIDLNREQEVILSLTSFPDRINTVWICIHSLLRQTVKPSRVILWLSEDQFANKSIPEPLESLREYGLSIEYRKGDLKPHKKTYYAFWEHPDAIVISVDDDIIYPESLVQGLLSAYQKYPDCVSCNLAHEIRLNGNSPDDYDAWNGGAIGLSGPSHMFTAIGVGGVLYPPHSLTGRYFDQEKIKALCLYTDDLWLKYNEIENGIRVNKVAPHTKIPVEILASQKSALTKQNNGTIKRNDQVIHLLEKEFNIDWRILFDKG